MPEKSGALSNVEEAYRAIKRLMLQQKIVPGQKLLYRELTDWLGMSKTPIVNALNRLDQEGFVTSEPNMGYAVKPIDEKEIFDSYEVREALEAKALQTAIEKSDSKQIIALEEKFDAFCSYLPNRYDKKKMMLDCEFHLQIADMSGNDVLRYLLRRNFEHIILRTNLDNYAPERIEGSAIDHKNILKMIKEKNFLKGADLLIGHIRNARDHVLLSLPNTDQNDMETISMFDFGS